MFVFISLYGGRSEKSISRFLFDVLRIQNYNQLAECSLQCSSVEATSYRESTASFPPKNSTFMMHFSFSRAFQPKDEEYKPLYDEREKSDTDSFNSQETLVHRGSQSVRALWLKISIVANVLLVVTLLGIGFLFASRVSPVSHERNPVWRAANAYCE